MRTLKKEIMLMMMATAVSACLVGCNEKNNTMTGTNSSQTEERETEDRNKDSMESETMADRENNQTETAENGDESDILEGLDDQDTGSSEDKKRNDKYRDDGIVNDDGVLGDIGEDIKEGMNEIGDDVMNESE